MALLDLIIDKKDRTLNLNLEDDVIDATCLVHLGEVRHKFNS